MPTMDGYTATSNLREQGYKKTIVAVTASAMSEDSEKAVKAGCDFHIAKPIGEDFEDLITDILSLLKTLTGLFSASDCWAISSVA